MNVNTILSLFTPKDKKFIPLLKEFASVMSESGTLLHQLFTSYEPEERKKIGKLIKSEELKGDKLSARMFKELNATFITPFDREDIDDLSDRMEGVIDAINRVAQKILLYSPVNFIPSMLDLTNILVKGIDEVQAAVNSLDNIPKSDDSFRRHYKEIKRLEEKADSVYERGITDLFIHEKDPIELVKLKEIIQELEKSVNRVNTTGKVLKTIYVKYA